MYNLDDDSSNVDHIRVQVLGQALEGKASAFFQQCYKESLATNSPWTFKESIRKLRDCFLHKATALEAATKFENLIQGSKDVQTLVDKFKQYADHMTEAPSKYHLRRQFL